MGRKKKTQQEDVGPLVKASYWLAAELRHVMRFEAELAVLEWVAHRTTRRECSKHLVDADRRLALALEAYGEALRGGAGERVEAIVDELEISRSESRRPNVRQAYEDPIDGREERRRTMRDVAKKKKRLEELLHEGGETHETRQLQRQIEAWEEFI